MSVNNYKMPTEYDSSNLAQMVTDWGRLHGMGYIYIRECTRGHDLDIGYLLVCGQCGWLIDTCEPYWVSNSEHRCYHICCKGGKPCATN